MSLNYHLVKRKISIGPDKGEEKHFGQVRTGKVIPVEKICSRISKQSTASAGDVKLVINVLLDVMAEILEDGNIAQLGELGNFRLSAGSKGVKEEENFTTALFKKPRVVFTPGKLLKNMLPDVQFSRLPIITVMEECDQNHPL